MILNSYLDKYLDNNRGMILYKNLYRNLCSG